ncbi:TetR/AcrR family transcriptional regulator [Radiobacillus kanasensis]|uniref:TetR/AcrR family transcriptional regulator n=1 Tax=Radiobacillus kanasensis TaxID=2844358 RepID=UPI001E4E1F6D|nr:TetR/AcrR family transcriptional regulator [Radiobacillus kanasensis]UFT99223.1 TetR/AcrR family transcriptional regulator [Radiobacillus kanasensis]
MENKHNPVKKDKATHITKQNIIEIANRLFMTYGYRAVSTRQIADACGLTQPALYHHFKNKQKIYLEVIKATMQRTDLAVKRIVNRTNTIQSRVEQLSYYMLMNHEDDLTQMFHDVRHEMDADTQEQIREWWLNSYLNPVIIILKEAEANNEIQPLQTVQTNEVEMAYLLLDLIKSSFPNGEKRLDDSDKQQEAQRKSKLISYLFLHGIGKAL